MIKDKISIDSNLWAVLPVSANTITVLSLIITGIAFILTITEAYLYAFVLFCIAFLLDAIDGAVARAKGEVSVLGAYIDGTIDRFVDFLMIASIYIMLYPMDLSAGMLILTLLFLTVITPFVRAYAVYKGIVDKDANIPNVFGREVRGVLLIACYLTIAFLNKEYGYYIIEIIILLTAITIWYRIEYAITYKSKFR